MSQDIETCNNNLILPKNWTGGAAADYLRKILDEVSDGVYFVDTSRRILFWNRGAERLTGYGREEILGRCCADNILAHVDDQGTYLCQGPCPLTYAIRSGHCKDVEVYLRHKDGHRSPVSVSARPVCDADGRIVGAVETFRDNSTVLSARSEIDHLKDLAMLDPLTRLGNRRFVNLQLHETIVAHKRSKIPGALLMFDIDHFKEVNDRYGHDVGDRALITAAQAMRSSLRAGDQLGRMGGDEFIALLRNATEAELQTVGQRCLALIKTSVVRASGVELTIQVSVGGNCLQLDDTNESVIKRVDQMLYASKENGRGRLSIG